MSKIIALALDDGHGLETVGKQSPLTGMKENEFNRAVVGFIAELCKTQGILYKEVAPGDTDVPRMSRINTANTWYNELKKQYGDNLYCLYLSCHANAGGGTGTEIWVHSKAEQSTIDVASAVIKGLAALGLNNRGIKKGYITSPNLDFDVNYYTNMASMLIEYAFMDTPSDAQLLLSDDFRKACAKATVNGVLNYLGERANNGQASNAVPIAELTKTNTITAYKDELIAISQRLAEIASKF